MSFGSKQKIEPVEVIKRNEPEQVEYDRQKNTEYNNREKPKKRRLFGKKDDTNLPPTSNGSDTIFREVNLFWPETIAIVGAFIAGLILMFVVRFMSAQGLELMRDMLTDQAYVEVAGMLNNINTLFLGVAAIPFLVLIAFYAYRLFVFTPRGNKHLTARIKRTGAIRFSVDKIKNGKLKFEHGIMGDDMTVTNPRKHWVEQTGKPCIVLFEGDDSNADLNLMAGDVSQKAKDTNTINDMMFDLGVRWERKMREKAQSFFTPTNIILIGICIGIVFIAFMVLKNPETTAGLLGGGLAIMGKPKGGFVRES